MAAITASNVADASVTGGGLQATPQNYTSLANLIDPTKPDVRDLYVQTYGDQGITGFLELTGAKKNAGTSDKVEWYEEGRLHKNVTGVYDASEGVIQLEPTDIDVVDPSAVARVNDVLLSPNGLRLLVTAVNADGNTTDTGATLTVVDMQATDSSTDEGTVGATGTYDGAVTFAIIGNIHAQGTEQPTAFYQTGLIKRENPYIIVKEMYEVNGSQATNIGWLNVNGQYMWYLKNEMDARKRFMNEREMMLLYSQMNNDTSFSVGGNSIVPSEGYFDAVEKRGITTSGSFGDGTGFADIDTIILELDKEGAPGEYAMYLNRQTSLDIDDMLADGIGTSTTAGLAGQFGAFNNSPDMAVQLGFKSFTRGGYTFHKHDWKLLNDPTLGAVGGPKGAMIPMAQVADANTGVKSPALELNYKAAGNYSREMEHWVEGGGVLGHVTSGKDTVKFNYRSECNLVTRAANQHVLIK